MDVSCTPITLHPQAHDMLFKHLKTLRRLFSDVLWHLEIDYMSIALLNQKNELLFLSSRPSIEHELIEKDLLPFDASLRHDFILQGKAQVWADLYQEEWHKPLLYFKQEMHGYSMGISAPSTFEAYRVVYSFALESTDIAIKNKVVDGIETLISMGRFCLQNILNAIPLPDRQPHSSEKKPSLKLVINNKASHEPTT